MEPHDTFKALDEHAELVSEETASESHHTKN